MNGFLMDILNFILLGKKFGICAFCEKKVKLSDSVFSDKNLCICHDCNSIIKIAPFNFIHKGTEHVSFVVSPLYYTSLVRNAIHSLKFSAIPQIASALAYYINTYIEVFEESGESLISNFDVLIPVPLSKKRQNERGYNQAELLALDIGKHFNLLTDTDTLKKIKDTPPQSKLSQKERRHNLEGAYECRKDIRGKRVLLVDDVFTTGTTLEECAKELINHGALSVGAITAAYASMKEHSPLYNELFS